MLRTSRCIETFRSRLKPLLQTSVQPWAPLFCRKGLGPDRVPSGYPGTAKVNPDIPVGAKAPPARASV